MPMSDVMTLFPTVLVVLGSALAITSWARPHGLPRTSFDRRLEAALGLGDTRTLDLVLSLLIVLGGVTAALA